MREQPDFAWWYPHLVSITYYRVHHVPYPRTRGDRGEINFLCHYVRLYRYLYRPNGLVWSIDVKKRFLRFLFRTRFYTFLNVFYFAHVFLFLKTFIENTI